MISKISLARRTSARIQRSTMLVRQERHIERNIERALGLAIDEGSGQASSSELDARSHFAAAKTAAVARLKIIAETAVTAVRTKFKIHDTRLVVLDVLFDREMPIVIIGN